MIISKTRSVRSRQLGGSFGIAVLGAYLTRHIAYHRADLVTNMYAGNPAFQERYAAIVAGLSAQGVSITEAQTRAYAVLVDEFELSLGDIAERVGASKPAVSNRLRLLELADDILAMVERGELTEGHARAVLAVPDNEGRRRLARKIVRQGLSVRAAEREARWSGAATKRRRRPPADPELAERVKIAAERLTGFRARVSARGLEIPVDSEVGLEELAEALERAADAA